MVLMALARKWASSFAKAISIGLSVDRDRAPESAGSKSIGLGKLPRARFA
jgi:hypothetical protein